MILAFIRAHFRIKLCVQIVYTLNCLHAISSYLGYTTLQVRDIRTSQRTLNPFFFTENAIITVLIYVLCYIYLFSLPLPPKSPLLPSYMHQTAISCVNMRWSCAGLTIITILLCLQNNFSTGFQLQKTVHFAMEC